MQRKRNSEAIKRAVIEVVEEEFDVFPQPGPQELLLECPITEILFGGARGGGKAQPLNAHIITPFGIKTMGDMRIGTQVCNPDGTVARVIAVHPQGFKPVYKITFADGAITRCSGEHLWKVRFAGGKTKAHRVYTHNDEDCSKWRLFTTEQLVKHIEKGRNKHASNLPLVELPKPVTFTVSNPYPTNIDPYLLGIILGDGHAGHNTVTVASMDAEIQAFLQESGFNEYVKADNRANNYAAVGSQREFLISGLERLGVYGKNAGQKFIPRVYKFGDVETRWAVLQGLMDSDGFISSDGKLYYTSISKQLAEDVQFLIESLGGWASISSKIGTYNDKDGNRVECQRAYELYIQIPDHSMAFRLPRKKERAAQYRYNGGKELFRKMVSIEPDGVEEQQCITVDHPNGLYLTNHSIVTHNSFATMLFCYKHAKEYGADAKILFIRRSYKELEDFMEKCQEFFPQLGWTWKAGIKTWFSPEGCLLKLRHLERDEDAMGYQGHGYTLVIVEEAGNFKSRDPIRKLKGAMRSAGGVPCFMILTANPGGPGHEWLKERFVDPAEPMTPIPDEKTGELRIFIPSRLEDNKILMENDPGYVNRLYDSGPSWLVQAWLEGEWNIVDPGNVFRREYWKFYDTPPVGGRIWQSWDTAFKKTDKSDRSAMVCGMTTPLGIYLLDAWADKVEFPELKKVATRFYMKWRPYIVYLEDKASGQSLAQELKRPSDGEKAPRIPVMPVTVDGDKLARAWASAPPVEQGRIFLPRQADWLQEFTGELEQFPNGSYDDWVDAFSQGVTRQKEFLEGGSSHKKPVNRAAQKKVLGSIFVR